MFIDKITRKRVNPYAAYTSPEGVRYVQIPADLYEEIPDPTPPDDYSDETYYRTEQQDAPYVVYTKKSPEQLLALRKQKLQTKRDSLWTNGGCKLVINGEDKWFHTDAYSKQQQMALTMMGSVLPEGLQWKTLDGTFVTMTPEIAQQLFVAQMTRETIIFATTEAKLNDETDIEEGWPEVYVEPEAVPDLNGPVV